MLWGNARLCANVTGRTGMSAEGLERRASGAVGDIDLAIARAATDEQTRLVAHVLYEADIAHRPVVHVQLNLLAWN